MMGSKKNIIFKCIGAWLSRCSASPENLRRVACVEQNELLIALWQVIFSRLEMYIQPICGGSTLNGSIVHVAWMYNQNMPKKIAITLSYELRCLEASIGNMSASARTFISCTVRMYIASSWLSDEMNLDPEISLLPIWITNVRKLCSRALPHSRYLTLT